MQKNALTLEASPGPRLQSLLAAFPIPLDLRETDEKWQKEGTEKRKKSEERRRSMIDLKHFDCKTLAAINSAYDS